MNTARLQPGQKVRFNGKTNIINYKPFTGRVGTVDFQCSGSDDWMVYINIRAEGQRKDRCISVHRESLEVA